MKKNLKKITKITIAILFIVFFTDNCQAQTADAPGTTGCVILQIDQGPSGYFIYIYYGDTKMEKVDLGTCIEKSMPTLDRIHCFNGTLANTINKLEKEGYKLTIEASGKYFLCKH